MISRILRVIFIFAVLGFSSVSFQNGQIDVAMTNLHNDYDIRQDSSFDYEMFAVVVFLLFMLGYAVFVLVSVINRTHQWLLDQVPNQDRSTSFTGI